MTDHFTFREEVLEKYDQEVYERYMETFDYMPLAAVIGGNYLCMHGGISPKMRSTHEI
jgi:serine/threonine-protein phosphatase 2B catalytic subunit